MWSRGRFPLLGLSPCPFGAGLFWWRVALCLRFGLSLISFFGARSHGCRGSSLLLASCGGFVRCLSLALWCRVFLAL